MRARLPLIAVFLAAPNAALTHHQEAGTAVDHSVSCTVSEQGTADTACGPPITLRPGEMLRVDLVSSAGNATKFCAAPPGDDVTNLCT
ncbi:hypothetical protein [Yinghuangia sp. YIM S10712]|uniref:hypothetical protein n=1 Tax=Yinghuangia sp. YIM S10712 TaxID=3436930 RepID=UPI003F52E60E